jgi:HD-GYP domain-containing protein (c-di-GMP phosphodiesterase class II)
MTSERPHATARSVEDAVAELHRCSGTQFDPAVVAAFTDVVTRGVVAGTPAGAAGQNI